VSGREPPKPAENAGHSEKEGAGMQQQLTEIRWHARAGQGAVTAAKLVAETALELDRYIQAMPEYGPERMGAPIQAFTRISEDPIEIHNNIENPSVVVVLDETLLPIVDVAKGLTDDGIIIVNTCSPPSAVRAALGIPHGTVATVDATGISVDTLKRDMPNTPMIGALAKLTGLFTLEQVSEHLAKTFGKKFSQEVIDANVAAVTRAYEEVQSS
jgi:pyruvate ferredoxin oxidoreductase gamma subunit